MRTFHILLSAFLLKSVLVTGLSTEDQDPKEKWAFEWNFSGISTFGHLPHINCLLEAAATFDIGIIGVPFDTSVSYRNGARFGPKAIRAASARHNSWLGFNPRAGLNPFVSWARIVDCGDIPVTPYDNVVAFRQMTEAFLDLGSPPRPANSHSFLSQKPVKAHRKLITLGGDHSVALPALRALNQIYNGPVAVLHFDAHLDTWAPESPNRWASEQANYNHGSMFWIASNEGLILNGSSVHAGLRTRLGGLQDYENDSKQGFLRISSDDIDVLGTSGIVEAILKRIGKQTQVYLSVDIDVIDPGLAPGTGTPEAGGWTARELISILRGIEDLNVVGADVVEVSPAYDGRGEQTALLAAQIVYEIMTSMVKQGLQEKDKSADSSKEDTVGSWKDEL